jgi:hypothetical protein
MHKPKSPAGSTSIVSRSTVGPKPLKNKVLAPPAQGGQAVLRPPLTVGQINQIIVATHQGAEAPGYARSRSKWLVKSVTARVTAILSGNCDGDSTN